jgi:hypothetical protein
MEQLIRFENNNYIKESNNNKNKQLKINNNNNNNKIVCILNKALYSLKQSPRL